MPAAWTMAFTDKPKNRGYKMIKYKVGLSRYREPLKSVRQVVEHAGGLQGLQRNAKVILKPNIVMWTKDVVFPKWGIITTSRVIEDVIIVLKDHGIDDITIAEGMVTMVPKDRKTPAHAFDKLGYHALKKRYGVKLLNVMERPFEKVVIDDEITLKFNTDILHCDYVVNIPVLKTHAQTIVSLGIKNLKGVIDISSRKKCHSVDSDKDLHYMVSRLGDKMPPMFTLIDGIYSNERGPVLNGQAHRKDILIASNNTLSADMVGTRILGWPVKKVPYLSYAAGNQNRPTDLSDIRIMGENIEDLAVFHEHKFAYGQTGDGDWLPIPMLNMGIKGVSFRKYDLTMCTYCSGINGILLSALHTAWKGKPFDKVEVLTGKKMKPTKGMNKTILVGKCMVQAHKDNPDIKEMIAIKGCPPKIDDIEKAMQKAGMKADPALFENAHLLPGLSMKHYVDRPEFSEDFFTV